MVPPPKVFYHEVRSANDSAYVLAKQFSFYCWVPLYCVRASSLNKILPITD